MIDKSKHWSLSEFSHFILMALMSGAILGNLIGGIVLPLVLKLKDNDPI